MQWSTRYGFILSTIGISVGLGNIWRFPYVTGTNGGGAFVITYLIVLALFALPILIAELIIGRQGRSNLIDGMGTVMSGSGRNPRWRHLGWAFVILPALALSYYGVISGWVIDYAFMSARGIFHGASPDVVLSEINKLQASPIRIMIYFTLFMTMLAVIMCRDLNKGLERFNRIAMPLLALLLIGLVLFACLTGDFVKAAQFMFVPDFSKINSDVILQATGQAFFSLGVGAGGIMAYGAYASRDLNIPRSSVIIAMSDTCVALLAGFLIFPLVFAAGASPASGPELIFITLPSALANLPGGSLLLTAFFGLVFTAAITTSLAMLECPTRVIQDKLKTSRARAAILSTITIWAFGILSVLSFNHLKDTYLLGGIDKFETSTIFDLIDYFVANIFMPINGLIVVLVAGWLMRSKIVREEYGLDNKLFRIWAILIRFIAPIGLIALLLHLAF